MSSMPADREAVLARGDALWGRLRASLDAHTDEPVGPATDWTGRDVYAHFARWQADSLRMLRQRIAGQPVTPLPDGEDVLNERWRREDAAVSADDARDRCLATRAELRDALLTLSEDDWRAWGYAFAPDINGEHYEHHLAMCGQEASA